MTCWLSVGPGRGGFDFTNSVKVIGDSGFVVSGGERSFLKGGSGDDTWMNGDTGSLILDMGSLMLMENGVGDYLEFIVGDRPDEFDYFEDTVSVGISISVGFGITGVGTS